MELCQHCRHELTPGFDFCHQCGAALSGPRQETQHSVQHVVDAVDRLRDLQSQAVQAGSSLNETVDGWLGDPISPQRQVIYSLLTGLALVLAWGFNPFNSNAFDWLQGWLVLSFLFFPLIRYQLTGLIPFGKLGNALMGNVHTFRRRLNLTIVFTVFPGLPIIFLMTSLSGAFGDGSTAGLADSTDADTLTSITQSLVALSSLVATGLGVFLINFYLMGIASFWRHIDFVDDLGGHVLGEKMSSEVERSAAAIQAHLEERSIPDLRFNVITMDSLRRHTAGESSGRQGQQLIITQGRARLVLFIREYGGDLYVRWLAYYNASGRRMWVLTGLALSSVDRLIQRWTGTSASSQGRAALKLLAPVVNSQDAVLLEGSGIFARFTGGLSEYAWNDIIALESAVRESVRQVVEDAQAAHHDMQQVAAGNLRQIELEAEASRSSGPPTSTPGGAGVHR